jgi:hypothetical protein
MLQIIYDANAITMDNITLFSFLKVSMVSSFNETIVHNNTTLLSSLNVSGFTILGNSTSFLSSLNVSGITNLYNSLNVTETTNIYSSLNVQGVNILNSTNNLNSIINDDVSPINMNASDKIQFIVNNTQLTQINISG